MRHEYRYKYKNIEIRPLLVEDLENLRCWRNNPANTKFLRKIPYITSEMQKNWYYSYLNDEKQMTFAIDEIKVLNQVVGSLTLYNFQGEKAEVGKILVGNPKAHGKNVCANALYAVIQLARDELKLKGLYLQVYKDNIIALKVYKKVGFCIEKEYISEDNMVEYVMKINL